MTASPTIDKQLVRSGPAKIQSLVSVAAIGASAGGLEPIEQFFDAMPANSECAFIIIQHLSPDFRSLMDELLARHSTMKILRIEHGMEIEPNTIYLNTPRSAITIEKNQLHVKETNKTEAINLPIDLFFESLAKDRGSKALGLVLSGTGTDGTRGSEKIRAVNGNVLVQEPSTTGFDGMPRSVLSDGFSTLVGSPQELAKSVLCLLNNEPLPDIPSMQRLAKIDPLADVLSMLHHNHGTDFLQYKEGTIQRRIERRAQMMGIDDISNYRDVLASNSLELQELYADLLIEVTEFFRDGPAFDILKFRVLPDITRNLKDGSALRVWVPGCASGEEAYSIAMLMQEQARKNGTYLHLKILATDIHVRSMNQASSGIYNQLALKNLPNELIERYFDVADGQAQIKPMLRNMVFFSTHDVTRDPPFTRIDFISCRNLLIYLKEEAQEKVIKLLHFSLKKDGYLFLGPSEHISGIPNEFEPIDEKWRIYKKRRDVKLLATDSILNRKDMVSSVARKTESMRASAIGRRRHHNDDTVSFRRAHRAALESVVSSYAPPSFLLSDNGVVAHIFGNAGELIPVQHGEFSRRIVDLIRPDLKIVVTAALDNSKHPDFENFQRIAYIRDAEETATSYRVSLNNIVLPNEVHRFQLLVIEEVKDPVSAVYELSDEPRKSIEDFESSEALVQRISLLEHSLQTSEESLQSTIEELETSNEELQSTNEELMSTNEELQSTNEELHSVNEELYTVSAEHQRKNEELTERDSDIQVLLQSSKIGTLHLDKDLCLRRYSSNARSVFNILPQDVGRPIDQITNKAEQHDLLELIKKTHQLRRTHETQLFIDDHVFLIRIMSYQGEDSQLSSVLITVIDITDVENIRGQLVELGAQYKDIIEITDSFIVRWDAKTELITYCNPAYASRWGYSVADMLGSNVFDTRETQEQKIIRKLVSGIEPNGTHTTELESQTANDLTRTARVFIRAVSVDGITIDEYQANGYDCTEEVLYRDALEKLYSIFADNALTFDEKLTQFLELGIQYFGTETASLGTVTGDLWTVTSTIGDIGNKLVEGDSLRFEDTFSYHYLSNKSMIAISNVTDSEFNGKSCHTRSGIESIIGAAINSHSGPYGTVNFSSQKPRNLDFSVKDEHFALQLGSWIGLLVSVQEQMDFVTHQNDYYKSLFKTVPTMMFLCDEHGLIISASDRFCEKLGISIDEMLGKNCIQHLAVDNKEQFSKAIQNGNTTRLPLNFGAANNQLATELNCRVKTLGTMQGVRLCILVDVSERNAALKELKAQNNLLTAANENLNRFAFIASHDLQEPLRKIQQFSNFLEEDLNDNLNDRTQYHLDVIVDASSRMSTLIHDLLTFSGATKDEPKIENISLDTMISEIIEDLNIPIKESNATITVGKLPTVEGDAGMVRQLFTNLIQNAIKYTSETRTPEINITIPKTGGNGVDISDNGIGFDTKYADQIMEPFNRLHRNNEYRGNGIGLAICSTVCVKHGWKLTADSELDVGSTFSIRFV